MTKNSVSPQVLQFFTIVNTMSDVEKGMIKAIITYGKDLPTEAGRLMQSEFQLNKFGQGVNGRWVANNLYQSLKEGIGFFDKIRGLHKYYGKQLDKVIKKTLRKAYKLDKPQFPNVKTTEGALQREKWLTETIMTSLVKNINSNDKRDFALNIDDFLKDKKLNSELASTASVAIVQGGLIAIRAIMGVSFNFVLLQTINLVSRFILGRALTVATASAIGYYADFLLGPVGWILTILLSIPVLTAILNRRQYDKFLPTIFLIGLARLANIAKY
jgi:uncharacterized protein YaaW (UPF0174 family)